MCTLVLLCIVSRVASLLRNKNTSASVSSSGESSPSRLESRNICIGTMRPVLSVSKPGGRSSSLPSPRRRVASSVMVTNRRTFLATGSVPGGAAISMSSVSCGYPQLGTEGSRPGINLPSLRPEAAAPQSPSPVNTVRQRIHSSQKRLTPLLLVLTSSSGGGCSSISLSCKYG